MQSLITMLNLVALQQDADSYNDFCYGKGACLGKVMATSTIWYMHGDTNSTCRTFLSICKLLTGFALCAISAVS